MATTVEFRLLLKSVRYQCRKGFTKLEDPLNLFHELTCGKHPLPPIPLLNTILAAIARMKHYSTAVSLSHHLDSLGLRPNNYSLSILINCYCHLDRTDFGFSLLSKTMKLGYEPDCVIFTTLINGLIVTDRLMLAADLFDKIYEYGFRLDLVTYGTLVKGLCKIGDTAAAIQLLRKMEGPVGETCKPGVVIYSTIIDSLCKGRNPVLGRETGK